MRRVGLLVTALLAGCASRPVVEEPTITSVPAALIADSGASFYVLETWEGWLEDGSLIYNEIPDSKNSVWIGENVLRLVLRHGLSQKSVLFVGHADFQPTSGFPMEVTLFNPDAEAHGSPPNRRRVGFRIRLKATTRVDLNHVDVEWEADQVMDGPESSERDGRPGQFPRVAEKIAAGSGMIPFGASLVVRQPKGDGRAYFILLRIASLK